MDLVPWQYPNTMHTHLSGAVGQYLEAILELYPKHRIRQWLNYRPLKDNGVLFSFRQFILLQITLIDSTQTRF